MKMIAKSVGSTKYEDDPDCKLWALERDVFATFKISTFRFSVSFED